jgi:cell division protein ZapD
MPDVLYEQPLNERMRILMRLEHLFRHIAHSLERESLMDCRVTVMGLLEVLNIFERTDLKSEIVKELERHAANLARLENAPGVDQVRLEGILGELDALIDGLYAVEGPIGYHLRANEFLAAIQQRTGIPGGTCDFDLPGYHYWLTRPAESRRRDLEQWLSGFDLVRRAVVMVLSLIRQSTPLTPQVASAGFYQQALDGDQPCQMVRVAVPEACPYYAEVSGGKHRFSVRFMGPTFTEKPAQTGDDVAFRLACCSL